MARLGPALGTAARLNAEMQRLLREPPAALVSGILDTDLPSLAPEDSLSAVTRYFAAYNLVCGPVVDEAGHLLGAVSVDDLLDEILPRDWRETEPEDVVEADGYGVGSGPEPASGGGPQVRIR